MSQPHVVILDGGPSGVGGAFELRRRDKARVTLLEQTAAPMAYIDFGSSDSSVEHARTLGVEVVDLDSTNGTFVNGQRVDKRATLKAGDRLGVGRVELIVESA